MLRQILLYFVVKPQFVYNRTGNACRKKELSIVRCDENTAFGYTYSSYQSIRLSISLDSRMIESRFSKRVFQFSIQRNVATHAKTYVTNAVAMVKTQSRTPKRSIVER